MQYKLLSCRCKSGRVCAKGCTNSMRRELNTFDYLADLPAGVGTDDFVEVQFKSTRKGYYLNSEHLPLQKGDMVAVESSPGYDIGEVTLTGALVELQMKKIRYRTPKEGDQRIFRLASEEDMRQYEEFKSLEQSVMIRSRQIARDLGLDMKIGDVEYQGDGQKAIFYYIADGRVDFRQLIKELARAFRIRVEMRQIGVRQEAGRIGGIGPCGRALCCSGWMTNFVSVGTQAARLQDFSMNPQKLAGQCGKLKCCINFEVDTYFEARQHLPNRETRLETQAGTYRQVKADILSGQLTYALQNIKRHEQQEPITISAERVHDIISANKRGEVPFSLNHDEETFFTEMKKERSKDILAESSLTRFDDNTTSKPKRRKKRKTSGRSKQVDTPRSEKRDESVAAPKRAQRSNKSRRKKGASPKRQGSSSGRDASNNQSE